MEWSGSVSYNGTWWPLYGQQLLEWLGHSACLCSQSLLPGATHSWLSDHSQSDHSQWVTNCILTVQHDHALDPALFFTQSHLIPLLSTARIPCRLYPNRVMILSKAFLMVKGKPLLPFFTTEKFDRSNSLVLPEEGLWEDVIFSVSILCSLSNFQIMKNNQGFFACC